MFRFFLILILLCANCNASNEYIRNYIFSWIEEDKNTCIKYLQNAIEIGEPNADAAFILGSLYVDGKLIEKDFKKADYYLTISAQLNHPGAINSIGDGYYIGDIRQKDLKKALKYYERAGKMGYGPAQFNAGIVLYKYGSSKKDLKKAIFWLDKASKNYDDLDEIIINHAKAYKQDAENKLHALSRNKKQHR